MRGGFVACLDGDVETLQYAAKHMRWHTGQPLAHATGRLKIIAGVDRVDGPTIEQAGLHVRLAHGTGVAPLTCLQRGRQRFAALEWNGRVLRASRDPMGLAPLFYRVIKQSVWLSTEIWPLLALAPNAPDLFALAAKAAFAPIEDCTGWRDVRRVLPGATIEVEGSSVSSSRYWDPGRLVGTYRGTRAQAADELQTRMRAAVHANWSDNPAVLLSGGLDSAAVTLCARPPLAPPHLIHVHFPDVAGTDELTYARAVADAAGAPLHVVSGDVQTWDPSEDAASLGIPYDWLPFGMDDPAFGHLATAGIDVALDGHDGDGILGVAGCDWGELAWQRELGRLRELADIHGVQFVARRIIFELAPPWVRRVAGRGQSSTYSERMEAYFYGPLRERIVAEDLDRWARPGRWWRDRQIHPLQPRATVSLEQKEIHAARYGIDMRHPFADRGLVEFLVSLPCAVKMDPDRPKALLRDAMAGLFPAAVLERGKSDYMAVVNRRVKIDDCLKRIRDSDIRLPYIDYDRFFADAAASPDKFHVFFVVQMARLHAFADTAAA